MATLVPVTTVVTGLVTEMAQMAQAMVPEMGRLMGQVIALARIWIFLSYLHMLVTGLATEMAQMAQAMVPEMGRPMGQVIALAHKQN